MEDIIVIPYVFRKAKGKNGNLVGYWVTLYLFFTDANVVHTFFHQSEWLDNMCLCRELGVDVYPFTKEILVTDTMFPKIFESIEDYVSKSNFNR